MTPGIAPAPGSEDARIKAWHWLALAALPVAALVVYAHRRLDIPVAEALDSMQSAEKETVEYVTWLGEDQEIIAGDTGPGCGLIDEWAQTMADLPHDRDGQLASKGQVDESIVRNALASPFFRKKLPKSADRYDFDHVDVSTLSGEDGAATLCASTARSTTRRTASPPASSPAISTAASTR